MAAIDTNIRAIVNVYPNRAHIRVRCAKRTVE